MNRPTVTDSIEWISVDNELPDGECNWSEWIVCIDGFVIIGRWYPISQKWYDGFPCTSDNDITEQVTHWRPFPEPPNIYLPK